MEQPKGVEKSQRVKKEQFMPKDTQNPSPNECSSKDNFQRNHEIKAYTKENRLFFQSMWKRKQK